MLIDRLNAVRLVKLTTDSGSIFNALITIRIPFILYRIPMVYLRHISQKRLTMTLTTLTLLTRSAELADTRIREHFLNYD